MIHVGQPRRRVLMISLVVVLFVLVCGVLGVISEQYYVSRQAHQEEMRLVIQHFSKTLFSIEGQSNPQVMAEIATDGYLDYLLRTRCIACPNFQVARRLEVVELQVLDYSSQTARVYARIEYNWNIVSPTGQIIGPCHAQAFSSIATLVKQDGLWRVSGGDENVNANRVDDSPQLLAKYCSDK